MTETRAQSLHESPPWRWYTDPEHFELERRLVHRTAWHYVGPLEQYSTSGRAATTTLAGMSIVVIADEGGTVRAFPNASGAPDELPVATWGPLLFVKPSHDGPDFDDVMRPLIDEIATRLDVDSLLPAERNDYVIHSNWKVWIENFNECYHCAVAHPEFTKVVHTNTRYQVERLGTYTVSHTVPFRADPDRMFYYAYAWPFLALGVSPGSTGLTIIAIRPEAVGSTTMSRELYQPPGTTHQALLDDIPEDVIQQDIDLCAMVQRGLSNGAYAGGSVVDSREAAILVFHELLAAHMGSIGVA